MDDVLSIRRQRALAQRARAQQLRLKDMQVAEKRFLDLRLLRIAWDREKTESSIERDIRMLNDELRQNRRLQEDGAATAAAADYDDIADAVSIIDMRSEAPRDASATSRDRLKRVYSAPAPATSCERELSPRIGGANIKWRLSNTRMTDRPCCLVDQRQANCPYFPCSPPGEYHHIGFDIRTDRPARERFSTSTRAATDVRDALLDELEATSVRRMRRSTLDQCRIKERALRKLIADMKQRSETNRPKDWCTNYGVPTSRRKILKAARPTSMEDFQGIL